MDLSDFVLAAVALGTSFIFLGLFRTAVWLLPTLFLKDAFPLFSASILSFFLTLSWVGTYRDRAYDFRSLSRERFAIVFLLAGLGTGLLSGTSGVLIYGLGALFFLLLIQVFKALRHPVSHVVLGGKYWSWILSFFALSILILRWHFHV